MTNRPIKFRAFNKDIGKMWEVKRLDFGTAGVTMDGYGDLFPLMQFTGLTDKNGKEIYEGDVYEATNLVGNKYRKVVEWVAYGYDHQREGLESCEVIGNIHENPELTHEKGS